jgi:hypothetical protein
MNTLTAYDKFVSKVNALDTSRGVNPDPRQFVFIFNEEMQKWIDDTQREDQNNIDIEGLQELYEPYRSLTPVSKRPDVTLVSFQLPEDFFIRIDGRVVAVLDGCSCEMNLEFAKPRETEIKMTSVFHRTSFEMEQAIGFMAGNKLNVFEDGQSTITKALFSYYRLPSEVDLEGYINEEGIPSTTKNTELSTFIMNAIIDKAATEFYVRNTDQIRTALAKSEDRT